MPDTESDVLPSDLYFSQKRAEPNFILGCYFEPSKSIWIPEERARHFKVENKEAHLIWRYLFVQPATSGLSRCRVCGKKIDRYELRIAKPIKDPRGDWGVISSWQHTQCSRKTFHQCISDYLEKSEHPEDLFESKNGRGKRPRRNHVRQKKESYNETSSGSPKIDQQTYSSDFYTPLDMQNDSEKGEVNQKSVVTSRLTPLPQLSTPKRRILEDYNLNIPLSFDIEKIVHGLEGLDKSQKEIILELSNPPKLDEIEQELSQPKDLDQIVKRVLTEKHKPPSQIIAPLLPYQSEGLAWMCNQEESDVRGGILADEMGMGKTLQMICLFLARKIKSVESKDPSKIQGANLVIAPLAAILQWKQEIERYTKFNSLSVLIYHGNYRDSFLKEISQYDVVITTYSTIEADYRRVVNKHKVRCKYCKQLFLPNKLRWHQTYFCGPEAEKTAKQNLQKAKSQQAAQKAMKTLNISNGHTFPNLSNVYKELIFEAKKEEQHSGQDSIESDGPDKSCLINQNDKKFFLNKLHELGLSKNSSQAILKKYIGLPKQKLLDFISSYTNSVDDSQFHRTISLSKTDIAKLKVNQLRSHLKGLNLSTEGSKPQLVSRLLESLFRDKALTNTNKIDINRSTSSSPMNLNVNNNPEDDYIPFNPDTKISEDVGETYVPEIPPSNPTSHKNPDKKYKKLQKKSRKNSFYKGKKTQRMGNQNKRSAAKLEDNNNFARRYPQRTRNNPNIKTMDTSAITDDDNDSFDLEYSLDDESYSEKDSSEEPFSAEEIEFISKDADILSISSGRSLPSVQKSPKITTESTLTEFPKQEFSLNDIELSTSPLHRIHWQRIVLDEAHRIKSRTTSTAQSVFALKSSGTRWCLTGTPLQNRVGELYSLVRFLNFDPYAYYFCSKRGCNCKSLDYKFYDNRYCVHCGHTKMSHYSYFNRKIINPIQNYGYQGEGQTALINLKNEVLDSILLRRTKEERASDVNLPKLNITIRRDALSNEELDFYQSLYRQSKIEFDTYIESGTLLHNFAHIFDLLSRLRQAVDHPYLIVHKNLESADSNGSEFLICRICQEVAYAHETVQSRCKHSFHKVCIQEYIDTAPNIDDSEELGCPVCYAPLTMELKQSDALSARSTDEMEAELDQTLDEITRKENSQSKKKTSANKSKSIMANVDPTRFTSSTKIEALFQELQKVQQMDPASKSIVFSQYSMMLEIIEWRLKKGGLNCAKYLGSMSLVSRSNILYAFNQDPDMKVLLISLKAGGEGLNLQIANNIFLMDPWWNPAAEMQAIQRAHRLGQKKPVHAIRFISKNTIEEKILELQEKKQLVFDGTVGAQSSAIMKLTPEDMKFLFTN